MGSEGNMGFKRQRQCNKLGLLFKHAALLLVLLQFCWVHEAKAIHQYEHPYLPCFFVMGAVPAAAGGTVLIAKPSNFGENKTNDFGTLSVAVMGGIVLGLLLTEQCNDYFFFINQPPIVSEIPVWPIEKSVGSLRSNMISLKLFSYRF
jgi:hypothetical protein